MKTIFTSICALLFLCSFSVGQDTLYIYEDGAVVIWKAVTEIDSITFYKPGNTVADMEGNVYKTVKIGSQVWMAENLKTRKYNDGIAIPKVTDDPEWNDLSTPAYCWYNNDSATYNASYGALYNGYTVPTGKLCPTGWHVPSDAEWKTLEMYLGLSQAEADKTQQMRGTDQATQLKNTSGWNSGVKGTNTCGFSALPGGGRYKSGMFEAIGTDGVWWTSTEVDAIYLLDRWVSSDSGGVGSYAGDKGGGLSVRCLRDE